MDGSTRIPISFGHFIDYFASSSGSSTVGEVVSTLLEFDFILYFF